MSNFKDKLNSLMEDISDRSIIMLDVTPMGDRSSITITGDEMNSERKGKGSWEWNDLDIGPGDETPWRQFMNFFWGSLEDVGLEPQSDEEDRYGTLGMSKRARSGAGVWSDFAKDEGGEVVDDDLHQMTVTVKSLGANPAEASSNLLNLLRTSAPPEWFNFVMDDDSGRPTIYVQTKVSEPGYDVGEINLGSFETNRKSPEVKAAASRASREGPFYDTTGSDPEETKAAVRDAYADWSAETGRGDDVYESADVYATALLLCGFDPRAVQKIMKAAHMSTTMSEDEMSEVRALKSAVISEGLRELVLSAQPQMYRIDRHSGAIKEDMASRYRRVLFTKGFAKSAADGINFDNLREHLAFKLQGSPADALGGRISSRDAKDIVNGLGREELDQIEANIRSQMRMNESRHYDHPPCTTPNCGDPGECSCRPGRPCPDRIQRNNDDSESEAYSEQR